MILSDVLHVAIEHLERITQTPIEIEMTASPKNALWDVQLGIKTGKATSIFKVEVKDNVLPAHVTSILDKFKKPETLLVAKYISNPAKVTLERQGVNYLDMAGNCFIRNDKGIFWFVKGQSTKVDNEETKHRAFNKNGIKLIYALLLNENLLNEPYRVMASKACISASTIGDILNDLQKSKFLVKVNKDRMTLTNKPELLIQWVSAFNKKLKPKLLRGRFNLSKDTWRQLRLHDLAFWGGEPAADLLTHYLHPGTWTLYTGLDRKTLINDLKLLPNPNGELEVYSLFWELKDTTFIKPAVNTVHPLLVYAELIGSGNDRNFETAQKIYEQHIKNMVE